VLCVKVKQQCVIVVASVHLEHLILISTSNFNRLLTKSLTISALTN